MSQNAFKWSSKYNEVQYKEDWNNHNWQDRGNQGNPSEMGTMYMYDGLDSPSISIFHLNHQSAIHLKTVIVADDIWMQT